MQFYIVMIRRAKNHLSPSGNVDFGAKVFLSLEGLCLF